MIHDYLGIKNNRVIVDGASREEDQNFMLAPHQDQFYFKNMFANYLELTANFDALKKTYKALKADQVAISQAQTLSGLKVLFFCVLFFMYM